MKDLEVKNLNLTFKKEDIFTDLSFCVKSGTFTSILINKNKKSLMNILANIIKTNNVYINDKNITREDIKKIGYVFEQDLFICETVEEEILYGLDSSEYEEDLENILSLLNITDLRKMSIKYLSKTEKKLVKLGASLIKKPDILILDNTFGIFKNKDKIIKILKKINKENKMTIINLTNDVEELIYGNEIIIIDKTNILSGKTSKVLKEVKQLEELKLGLPFMVDLSNKLKYYDLVDENILKIDKMVEKIWE